MARSATKLILLLATLISAQARLLRRNNDSPAYRISPIDGSKIALPTQELLEWQAMEIGMLIHYNIATYTDLDGCNNVPHYVPAISLFDPSDVNTKQWASVIDSLGAKYATLVAKHNCGFATWPTKVSFELTSGQTIPYNYSIGFSPDKGHDIPGSFTKALSDVGLGRGFYYSVNVNNFLDVQSNQVQNSSSFSPGQVGSLLGPGQVNITQDTYDSVVLAQLKELWSNYGKLTEIWFDGGYSSSQRNNIKSILDAHQPQAVIFNGCTTDGSCISPNSVRWIGTESGEAPEENWSTGVTNDGGDPDSPIFCPAECDTTLQNGDRWFWGANTTLRSVEEMIDVYHQTVGHNCVLELDLAPDRTGGIPENQVSTLKQLGDFIRTCYGSPSAKGKAKVSKEGVYHIKYGKHKPAEFDRVVLQENQANGQVIRTYNVYARLVESPSTWTLLSNGTSIGNKKIDLLGQTYQALEIKVNTTHVDTPVWKNVGVHLCDAS